MSATRRRLTALLTALFAVGLLGLILAAVASPTAASIKAAVVNEDRMVEIDGQMVPMGRQLAAELVKQESRFDWEITTAQLAESGLADGTYAVVVTIPEDFSAALTSLSSGDEVVQGKITVQARPGATDDERYATEVVTRASTAALGDQITETFVSQMIGGLADMREQLGEAEAGASKLADGAASATEGIERLDAGARQLNDGATSAVTGLGKIDEGAGQLAEGTAAAASGLQELAAGTGALADGFGTAADGARQLSEGATELAVGLDQLGQGTAVAGDTAADGVEEAGTLLADGIQSQFVDVNNDFLENVVRPVDPYVQTILGYCTQVDPANALCTQLGNDGLLALGTLNGAISWGYIDGLTAGGDSLHGLITDTFGQVADGVSQGFTDYGQYVNDAADGAWRLADGAADLADGLVAAGDRAGELVTGTQQAADGASQLAEGAGRLAEGTGQATAGLTELADGIGEFADGTSRLTEGSGQLADGTSELADGLARAADQIPLYSDEQADRLTAGVTAPVETPSVEVGGISSQVGAAFAILLWLATFALVLLFPAFVAHIVDSVRPALRLALEAWWVPATWSAAVGATAGVVLGIWAQNSGGDLAESAIPALALLGALFGASFYAVQQALAASLGAGGRVIALALAGVAIIATLVVGEPSGGAGLIQSIAALLPTGLAARATNFLVVSGAPSGTGAFIGVLVWGICAFAVTVWATSRRRAKPH